MDDQYQISIRDLFIIHFVFTVVHLRFISDFLCHPAMAEAAACDAALPLLQAALSAAGGAGAWWNGGVNGGNEFENCITS